MLLRLYTAASKSGSSMTTHTKDFPCSPGFSMTASLQTANVTRSRSIYSARFGGLNTHCGEFTIRPFPSSNRIVE